MAAFTLYPVVLQKLTTRVVGPDCPGEACGVAGPGAKPAATRDVDAAEVQAWRFNGRQSAPERVEDAPAGKTARKQQRPLSGGLTGREHGCLARSRCCEA
jgi:hypothetical protein